MTPNVGSTDRIIRGVVAALALVLGIVFWPGVLSIVLIVVALIAGATAAISFCPLWVVLKVNTRSKDAA